MTDHDEGAVLVLTAPVDPTADLVILQLQDRGIPVVRLDSGDFPSGGRMVAVTGPGGRWRASFETEHYTVSSDEVAVVYYRRPRPFAFSDAVAEDHTAWCAGQMKYGFWGVIESLDVPWMNRPTAVAAAEFKPRQLAGARDVGLDVPATMISNNPSSVAEFAEGRAHGIVTKSLYARGPRMNDGGPERVLYTSAVPRARLHDPSIALTAHLVQEFVPKQFDVRLTAVDGDLYAAAIDDSNPNNVEDWRRCHHGLSYRPYATPPDVAERVRHLLARLGLRFAALDFLVTPAGDWVFVEVNPNGQWAWIEHETDLPIAAGIADALAASAGHTSPDCRP